MSKLRHPIQCRVHHRNTGREGWEARSSPSVRGPSDAPAVLIHARASRRPSTLTFPASRRRDFPRSHCCPQKRRVPPPSFPHTRAYLSRWYAAPPAPATTSRVGASSASAASTPHSARAPTHRHTGQQFFHPFKGFDHHVYLVSRAESLYEQAHSHSLMGSSAGSRPSTDDGDSYVSVSPHAFDGGVKLEDDAVIVPSQSWSTKAWVKEQEEKGLVPKDWEGRHAG
ncbi:hypothetical protein FIBSPDRAFT_898048 [Athelia psychrophila]|uniref:Uncharacterized protein n=1 Tax=Athelia psychrophila TaxID=1759441 RepID=A0A166BIF7_9AGAM|nr:hypothetical protein FIBSPDRAFT_898048 [Fibularhizoctonia sp. CBS 109695]